MTQLQVAFSAKPLLPEGQNTKARQARPDPLRTGLTQAAETVKAQSARMGEVAAERYSSRVPITNLKVTSFGGHRLQHAGTVGTGLSETVGKMLREKLDGIRAQRCILPGMKVAGAVWVELDRKAEVAYRGFTGSGELRAASFKGLAG